MFRTFEAYFIYISHILTILMLIIVRVLTQIKLYLYKICGLDFITNYELHEYSLE